MQASEDRMEQVAAGLPSKSAKIRALHGAGFPRSEIAKFLKLRYQHVRNVLVAAEARETKVAEAAQSPGEDATKPLKLDPTKVRMGPDGRVVVPAAFREALRLKEGDALIALVENGEVHLLTGEAAMRRAQAFVRTFVPEGVSLVDELLGDRRRETELEARNG